MENKSNNGRKKHTLTALLLFSIFILLASVNANAQTTIWSEAFDNTSNFTASGGTGYEDSDEYLNIKAYSASTWNYTGNTASFLAGRNIDDWRGSNNRAQFTWSNINIAGYNNLQFTGKFASMENKIDGSDKIEIHYRVNNGSWKRIIHLKGQSNELKEVIQNIDLSQAFTSIGASINDLGTVLDLRVSVRNFTKEDEDFAMDEFEITGSAIAPPVTPTWAFFKETFDSDTLFALTQSNFGTDGGTDYFMRTNSIPSFIYANLDGYVLAGRHINSYPNKGNDTKILEWQNIPVANINNLSFGIDAASTCDECEKQDRIKITYRYDNTGSWNNLLWFAGDNDSGGNNDEIAVDNDFNGTGEGTTLTSFFQSFVRSIPGTGNTITIRVRIEQFRGGGEDFALDNLALYGDVQNNQIVFENGAWNPTSPNEFSDSLDVWVKDGNVSLWANAEVKNVQVDANATLTIQKDQAITVYGDIVNNGTVNVLDHGILNQQATTDNNSGSGVYNVSRETPMLDNQTRYNMWSSPVVGEITGNAFGNANPNYIFTNRGPGYVSVGANEVMQPGLGYAASGDVNVTYPTSFTRTFSGNQVNNGDILVDSLFRTHSTSSIFIGNPYPSPINALAFAADNPQITSFLFWDHKFQQNSNGQNSIANWATYSPATNTGVKVCATCIQPDGTIGSAQGFVIHIDPSIDTTSVIFSNSQRRDENNHIFHAPTNMSKAWINLTNNTGDFDQIALVFTDVNTLAYEPGFEAKKSSMNPNLVFYSIADSHNLAIQTVGRPDLSNDLRIPLGVDAGVSGDFTFELDSLNNWSEEFNLYLIDKATGATTYIEEGQTYTFTVTTSASFTDRFYIEVRKVQTEDQSETIAVNQSDTVLTDEGHELDALEETKTTSTEIIWNGVEARVIENTSDISSWMVFNVNGQLIETLNSSNNSEIISAPESGIYLIKVTFDNGSSTTKKIFIR